jgi:AcrR family transcriptional regulator
MPRSPQEPAFGTRIRKPKTRRLLRRRRAPEERTEDILVTALDLFARRDFHGVSMREIASACGINIALIYYYFGSKEELFRAAIGHAIKQAMSGYRRLRAERRDPIDALNALFDINVRLYEPLSRLARILIDYRLSGARVASIDRMIDSLYADECALLAESIRHGIAQGRFRQIDAEEVARFVSTHLDGVILTAMARRNVDIKDGMAGLRRLLWDYLGADRQASAGRRRRNIATTAP